MSTTATTTTIPTATTTTTVNGTVPKATLQPKGCRLLMLISSMSGSLEIKSRQSRMRSILDGLLLPEDQVVIMDGADSMMLERRGELFQISGKRGQYPQLFLITPEGTKFVGDADEVFNLHDDNALADAIGMVVLPINTSQPTVALTTLRLPDQGETKPPAPTMWKRQPSNRHMLMVKNKRPSQMVVTVYKGKEPFEGAAKRIQRVTRLWILPMLKLEAKLKGMKEETSKERDQIKKDTQKKIAKIQKQYDKDCKTVDKLANDIRRYQKKQKLLIVDMKAERKQKDKFVKAQKKVDKEKERHERYTKKNDQYKRKVVQKQQLLTTWDKDIQNVQKENEKLLNCITGISGMLAMRGVNWIELNKATTTNNETNENENKESVEETKAQETKPAEATATATATTTAVVVPTRVEQSQNRLQSMMRRQEKRRSRVSMVRQESERLGQTNNNTKKGNKDSETREAPPVYFVRLNSRAKLVREISRLDSIGSCLGGGVR